MSSKLTFLTVLTALIAATTAEALAQGSEYSAHQTTTTPLDARFEIVQSQLAAKWTFRLDRYTGNVSQLVRTSDGGNAWEDMIVKGLPELQNATVPRFLLFTSGLAARHTFLIDTKSGSTWVVTETEIPLGEGRTETFNIWQPFQE